MLLELVALEKTPREFFANPRVFLKQALGREEYRRNERDDELCVKFLALFYCPYDNSGKELSKGIRQIIQRAKMLLAVDEIGDNYSENEFLDKLKNAGCFYENGNIRPEILSFRGSCGRDIFDLIMSQNMPDVTRIQFITGFFLKTPNASKLKY